MKQLNDWKNELQQLKVSIIMVEMDIYVDPAVTQDPALILCDIFQDLNRRMERKEDSRQLSEDLEDAKQNILEVQNVLNAEISQLGQFQHLCSVKTFFYSRKSSPKVKQACKSFPSH